MEAIPPKYRYIAHICKTEVEPTQSNNTMVELAEAPYDNDDIPFVTASVVCIDSELSHHTLVTAEAITSSPQSSLSNGSRSVQNPERSIPGYSYRTFDSSRHVSENESNNSNSNNDSINDNNDNNTGFFDETSEVERERQRAIGAGAAGAVLGLLVGGPLLSAIFGFGTAHFTRQDGAAGDLARALGEVALVARDKFKEVDSKHHIVDKGQQAAQEAFQRIQETDRRHHGREKFLKFVAHCWKSTMEFVERNRLLERGCEQLRKLAELIATKIQEHENNVQDHPYQRNRQ